MAIEVQRYPNKGVDPLEEQPPEALTIELPEEMNIQGETAAEFDISPDGQAVPVQMTEEIVATEHNINLADVLEETELSRISSELISSYDEDKSSREEWLKTFSDGLDLLGIKAEERDTLF